MANSFDVVIIGSGFGGAVTACRLAEAGRKVLVLERGREWKREDYPRAPGDAWIWDDARPEACNGWIDLRYFGDMTVVQGAAVGGGSLIYANISVEAEPFVFEDGWPAEITYEALKPHYATAARMLNVQELPDNQLTERFKLMRDAAEALGHGERFRKLPLAVTFDNDWHYGLDSPHSDQRSKSWTNDQGQQQGTCVHCGNCDIGCQVGAKNTLDLNYLAAARGAGAEVRANHIVRSLRPLDGDGYRVGFDRIEAGRLLHGEVTADRVVLAAGSLGSTELLLRCRDEYRSLVNLSDRLGYGWCSNGDFLTPAVYTDRRISPTRGPTITSAIDFLDGSQGGKRFFVEDGGFPDVLGNSLQEVSRNLAGAGGPLAKLFASAAALAGDSDPLDCVMPWFGQAVDVADGRMRLGRPWWNPFARKKLCLDWDFKRSEPVISAMVDMHKRLSAATGGMPVEPLYWRWFRDLITPHPLGGCAMADDPRNGVVDGKGRVHGHPGLYVADGSIFPRAIGLNPSRTIAALAERIAAAMAAE
ncbi:MAG: GMC family oxidoreductase [Kiloniellaceae bacterium]